MLLLQLFLDIYIALRYTLPKYIASRYIELKFIWVVIIIDSRLKRIYVPMTETCFYILYCLQEEMHGYNIGLKVKKMTGNEINISPGTMYGSLAKMEKDGLIHFTREEEKRKFYQITDLGKELLKLELRRISRLYINSKGELWNGTETI